MTDRFFGIEGCMLDDQFRLHIGNHVLLPCKRIITGDISIGIVDNKKINPKRLLILEKDKEVITVFSPRTFTEFKIEYPGKSAFLHFEECNCRKNILSSIQAKTDIVPDRHDNLFVATVAEIESAMWEVWWAPLQMRGLPMHCRMIPKSIIEENRNPTVEETIELSRVFKKQ